GWKRGGEAGGMCPKCGKPLVEQFSRKTRRPFIGCSGWREGCKYIKPREGEPERPEPIETEIKCPNCGKPMVQRMSRRGPFLGCSGYPEGKKPMDFDLEGKPVLASRPRQHTCERSGKPTGLRGGAPRPVPGG